MRKRTSTRVAVSAVAAGVLAVGVASAVAAYGTEPTKAGGVHEAEGHEPDPADLECTGPLAVVRSITYAEPPGHADVDAGEVATLIAELAATEDVRIPVSVEPATQDAALRTLAARESAPADDLFVARDADGRVSSIVEVGVVNGEVAIGAFAACSNQQVQAPLENLNPQPIPGPDSGDLSAVTEKGN
jgi:hypothetical protein